MIKSRRRSIMTVDDGGGTPKATVKSTTTTFRRRGKGRQATTRSSQAESRTTRISQSGAALGQNNNLSGDNYMSEDEEIGSRKNTNRTETTTMNYIEIKELIERRTLANKKEN